MLAQNNAVLPAQNEEVRQQAQQEQPPYDFAQCQRMKKLTTHDIYRFPHLGTPLIVKLFAPETLSNYQTELSSLQRASHPSTFKALYHRPSIDSASPEPLVRSHLIVMEEAKRGDLNDYLPRYGRMNEKMARSYFRNLVEALAALADLKPALLHPNLLPSNLLLTDGGQLRICGWSEINAKGEKERLRENIFCCGEILVCLLTSFPPFHKKYSPTDAYFKFLSSDQIHKFWQEIQKKIIKVDKKFTFSSEVKDLLESIFLKKFSKLEQLLTHSWTLGEVYSQAELLRLLEQNEKEKIQKIQLRKKQELQNQQKKRKLLHEYQLSFGLHRSSSMDENQQFIKDCEENIIHMQQIPVRSPPSSLKIQATPSFIIASLKDFFRHENGKCSVMLCQQFILSNYKVVKVCNYALIDLQFLVSDLEEEDQILQPELDQETVSLKLRLSFTRQSKEIFATVEVMETNFNSYYTNLALKFIQDRVQKRKQEIQ